MIKLNEIPNPEKLLSIIDDSRGDVFLGLPDGSRCDLKRESAARQLLRIMAPGRDGIRLNLSDPDDTTAFLRYMAEPAR